MTHTRDDKVGAIDAGRWAVPPRYQELDTFNSGYAWALPFDANSRNQTVLLDALGRKTALPDAVRRNGEYLDGGLITYYALDDDHERVWGLWDIRKNAPALKPSLAAIEKCEGDWARAQSGDRWGVIGRDGKWRIKPDYEGAYRLDYLGQGYMLTEEAKPAGQSDAYDSFYRLHHLPSGKASPLLRGKPQALEGGRQMGLLADGGTMLFDTRGGSVRLFQGKPENQRQFGDWISLSYDDRKGAIDARGNMKIAAENGEFNPFFVQPDGLARVNTAGLSPDGPERRHRAGQAGRRHAAGLDAAAGGRGPRRSRSVMVDMQGREIARFNKTYSVDASTASEGVVVYEGDNGRHGFVNAEGKRVVGPYFNKLGRCATGAGARAAQRQAVRLHRPHRPLRHRARVRLGRRFPRGPRPGAAWRPAHAHRPARPGRRLVLAGLRRRRHPGRAAARDLAGQAALLPRRRRPAIRAGHRNRRRTVMTLRLIPLTRLACAVAVLGLPWPRRRSSTGTRPAPTTRPARWRRAALRWRERRRQRLHPFHFRRPRRRAAAFRPALDQARADRHRCADMPGASWTARAASRSSRSSTRSAISITGWPPCSGKWGYIDARGRMAIAPRFDEVSDFVEAGLAIVTLDGKRQIIDRQGKPTGDALDASVDNAQLSDGLPARLIVRYRPEYQAPDGTRRYDEPGRRITGAYGRTC